jgi:predicted AlkP superfamily phosphohydrolase/phosphomutase
MSLFLKFEWRTVLAALIIVILCALLSFSSFVPLFVLVGHVAAAMYLLVGVVLSLRSPNELAMPPLQFAGRILHAQFFYALGVVLFADGIFLCVQALLRPLGFVHATRWAMLLACSLALSTPIVMAAFSRFLLSQTAGWDRLKYVIKGSKNLLALPLAIVAFSFTLVVALSLIIDTAITWTHHDLLRWLGLIVIWGGVGFLFARTDFQARNATLRKLGSKPTFAPLGTSKILFVGADAGDWHVIMPLVNAGRMPNLRNLMDTGCYGYLDTFGRMHSPVIWTTIATGASADRHGITGFFTPDPQKKEKRRLFEIQDRQVPAIWDMLSQMGRKVSVINWLLTYAPERVNGYMISRMREPAVYPEEFEELLTDALSQIEAPEPLLDMSEITTDVGHFRLVRPPEEAIKDLRRIRAVAPRFMRECPTDLTMVYEDATDGIQHTTWQYREPHRFNSKAWDYDVADIQRYGHAIDKAWEEFDEVLGVLLRELGPNGIIMVVSDHGAMPREAPSVYIDMNALLHDMGYLEFTDDGGVDFSRTAVYWSTREITSLHTELSVNLDRKMDLGTAKPSDLDGDDGQVTANLLRLKINGGKPLFDYVTPTRENGARSIRVGLAYETTKMGRGRVLEVGQERKELDSYLKAVPDGSGRHDPFGIFVFSGPGIRKGQVLAAGAVHTVLNDLLGHIRGLSQHPLLKIAFHVLDRFGIINPYTTNDIAPTLLYLADCPIPKYAVGSVMARSLSRELKRSRAVKYVAGFRYEPDETSGEYSEDSEQQVIERLRALGYID